MTKTIDLLIEEERSSSLLRIMRKNPLFLHSYIAYDTQTRCASLVYYNSLIYRRFFPRTLPNWIEYNGLEKLKYITSLDGNLNIFIPRKEAERIVKILELFMWPSKFRKRFRAG